MSGQEDVTAQDTPKILRRRQVIDRFGPIRLERQLLRFSSEGSWREFNQLYVILEATSQAEFPVGGTSAQALGDPRRLLRYLHYCLDLIAPLLEESDAVYGPWRPLRESVDKMGTDRPELGVVSRYEASALITKLLTELELANPDLRPDSEDDYLFVDSQAAQQQAIDYASREEWQRLHGEWPSPLWPDQEIGGIGRSTRPVPLAWQ